MVGSEASETWDHGGDIWLYRSRALGSNSWQRVKKVKGYQVGGGESSASCGINQRGSDSSNTVMIHCRKKVFISHNGPEGNYAQLSDLDIPTSYPDRGELKVGGSSMFLEDGDLYFITTRLEKATQSPRSRFAYIYKLNNDWTGLAQNDDGIVATWLWNGRESPYITKKDGWYYIFVSQTKGWKQSKTFYKRSKSMKSLPSATEHEVIMHPHNTKNIESMGSQFCFFQEFDDGKWMFGGRRHPEEAPELFAQEYGKHVMVPANFINGTPHVYWKYEFDWTLYDYNAPLPDYDKHDHFGNPQRMI